MISRKKYPNFPFPDRILLETFSKTSAENLLAFDIETTGFSWRNSMVFLIGFLKLDTAAGQWRLEQWLLDDPSGEKELLKRFSGRITADTVLLHYNGRQFDLPFLKGRCQALNLPGLPAIWNSCPQLDLYQSLRPYRKFLELDHLKLADLEHYLKLSRPDKLSGKECIPIYRKYILEKQSNQEEALLLHNQWDLISLLQGTRALACPAFFQGQFRLEQCQLTSDMLTCTLLPEIRLPRPLSLDASPRPWKISGTCDRVQIDFFLENGALRMYYPNYKDYYYLPDEDTAIHKSVGAYVDKTHRRQATAENCFTRFPCSIDFMQNLPQVEAYIRRCLQSLCRGVFENPSTESSF